MRWLFVVPDLDGSAAARRRFALAARLYHRRPLGRWLATRGNFHAWTLLTTDQVFGGTLNIMRHAAVARSLGAEALLCSRLGRDTYGARGIVDLPFVPWSDRRPDDVVVLPEIGSRLAREVRGRVVVYLQTPVFLRTDFDYLRPEVTLWTDSPFMLGRARAVFPGKDIPIVPNVVDPVLFPYRPQAEREDGLLFAFPRKNPEFIEATEAAYRAGGGRFWRVERISGLSIHALARRMQEAQAFLASAVDEGCALPPQESMACGMVVVGRSARGANFSMQHRETAMVAETPEEAAESLRALEDPALRDRLSRNGHAFIRRYFPDGEPSAFWRAVLAGDLTPRAAADVTP